MKNEALEKRVVGNLWFCPGQYAFLIKLAVVESLDDLEELLAGVDAEPVRVVEAGGGQRLAGCLFDHDAAYDLGYVVLAREAMRPEIVVHELVHAGLCFVNAKVMPSKQVQAKSEEEQMEYFEEACATVIENLSKQAFALLYLPFEARMDAVKLQSKKNRKVTV